MSSAGDERSDRELLQAHVDGDADAFGELFARHRDRLWAVALRTMGNPEDAADGLQDGMIAAFRRAGSEVRTAVVTADDADLHVLAGLTDLVVLKSTGSEFWGYPRDRYTTLPETRDRVLATAVTARWLASRCPAGRATSSGSCASGITATRSCGQRGLWSIRCASTRSYRAVSAGKSCCATSSSESRIRGCPGPSSSRASGANKA